MERGVVESNQIAVQRNGRRVSMNIPPLIKALLYLAFIAGVLYGLSYLSNYL
jgi:hypothetical protein